jgi:Mrp family chromosome partitioning ATPase
VISSPATAAVPDDGVWENSPEEAPYIEIGGPEGPVGSVIATKPSVDNNTNATAPTPSQRSPFPRLAEPAQPLYLSVRFHPWPLTKLKTSQDRGEPDGSLVVFHAPEHPISKEYKEVWQAIVQPFTNTNEPSHILYFVSPAAEAGTTTVVLNLALHAAQRSLGPVLVIDAHNQRPAVAERLGLASSPGLQEVLQEQYPLALALQPTCVEQLHLLAAGQTPATISEQIGHYLPRLLSHLRQWYAWVIVDAGIWGQSPQRDAACTAADAVYVVVRDSDLGTAAMEQLRRQVRQQGGLARGAIATRAA